MRSLKVTAPGTRCLVFDGLVLRTMAHHLRSDTEAACRLPRLPGLSRNPRLPSAVKQDGSVKEERETLRHLGHIRTIQISIEVGEPCIVTELMSHLCNFRIGNLEICKAKNYTLENYMRASRMRSSYMCHPEILVIVLVHEFQDDMFVSASPY